VADVFISYKREERQAVERLAQELRKLGLDVWFDASLNAGEAFSDEIDREARAAKAILVCWSPAARASDWVKAEALIGFTDKKLAACYAAGPDGFDPPAPFNAIHAEDMRAWLAVPSHTHAGWKSVLRRVGKLCGREDIESYGALDVQAPAAALRSWLGQHEASPLFMAVDELLRARDEEEAEVTRLEREARERRTRDEAERRAGAEAERHAGAANAKIEADRQRTSRTTIGYLAVALFCMAISAICGFWYNDGGVWFQAAGISAVLCAFSGMMAGRSLAQLALRSANARLASLIVLMAAVPSYAAVYQAVLITSSSPKPVAILAVLGIALFVGLSISWVLGRLFARRAG